jgi:putative sigma-54 modulation protein
MQINLQGKNIELTEAIKDYVLKRITNLEKLLSSIEKGGGDVRVVFEVGENTKHHKTGSIFQASCLINIDGDKFHYSSDKEDLYQAIDEAKESLYEEIRRFKDRKQTLFKRGAASIKKMLKGLTKRNPFTSKY